ncbi:lethal(3)malignant brain tumor-like protein 3 isoform X1 [Diorhabda carinulata]|uniref:lethal(3)malignant brain tumor-like protein 3 isoform X1 n=1 Tax=Diorhabda carinulata TaxID=1163345 RepID=UPI0025A2B10D|nr:lethal(3)malignant brain tumor-like protein 3 isoform X1 [Diorhabda carinulata]XP_057663462.1 lethal(3)malignant brain tumor-like protein 3 isoform X1 [Diorhabda carinulata]
MDSLVRHEKLTTEVSEVILNSVEVLKPDSDCDNEDSEDSPRRNGLFSITENLKHHRIQEKPQIPDSIIRNYGEATSPTDTFETNSLLHSTKPVRRKRMDRTVNNNGPISTPLSASTDFVLHNNNQLKNERLSPGTPDTSSRSRSVTPSSASHPDTPPAQENPLLGGRNYSDFMRSLAAKYNNANPNDYFNATRNGFPPPIDQRFKPVFSNLLPINSQNKENDANNKRSDFPVMNPFSSVTGAAMFPPLIDMSTTQTLLAMVRTAKEAEIQGLLKNVKRPDSSSPLDLSAAAPPPKRPRLKISQGSSPTGAGGATPTIPKRSESESPKLHEDISNWSVEDVCSFISGIDICSEYTQTFRDERIDGSGLPLLTEEHLTNTMNMKLGPALKLRSILAKKLGSCSVCLHCSHCHNSGSPEPSNTAGNTSDSGGAS